MPVSARAVTLSEAKGPERSIAARVFATLRRIAGMPDYAAHLEHLRRCHPEASIPTEREFYEEFLRVRYGDGPTRCC